MEADREKLSMKSSEIWISIRHGLTKFYHLIKNPLDTNGSLKLNTSQMVPLSNTKYN